MASAMIHGQRVVSIETPERTAACIEEAAEYGISLAEAMECADMDYGCCNCPFKN